MQNIQTSLQVRFFSVCESDEVVIPQRMLAEVHAELDLLAEHIQIVNGAVKAGSEPSNVFRLLQLHVR